MNLLSLCTRTRNSACKGLSSLLKAMQSWQSLTRLKGYTRMCKQRSQAMTWLLNCRGMAAVVKLVEPARSWWPQIGCTPLQTIAAAAVATIARVHSARRKICELGGIPALVQLIVKGTAEAQGHAARSLGLLAENRNYAYEVGAACRRGWACC